MSQRIEIAFAISPKASEKHKRCVSSLGFACAKTFIPLSVGGEIINIFELLSLEPSTSIILVRIYINLTQRSKKPDTARYVSSIFIIDILLFTNPPNASNNPQE